jgi:hypothetical protein
MVARQQRQILVSKCRKTVEAAIAGASVEKIRGRSIVG